MELKKSLEQFILFDKSNLLEEISRLKQLLKIDDFKVSINDMESIFIKNFPQNGNKEAILKHFKENKNKVLELYCNYNGKKVYLKSFGKIEQIDKNKFINIFKLLILIRLYKKIDEVSYFSSQYYRANSQFEELFEE